MYTHEEKQQLRTLDPFDNRNVVDSYKTMTTEEIRKDMQQKAYPFVAICENLINDFNISQVVRSVNAFGLESVAICGSRKWDRRGAVGTHHYTDINYYSSTVEAIEEYRRRGYEIIAAELTDDAVSLYDYSWPEKVAVVLGEEGKGLIQSSLDAVDKVVYIPQRGTVRSLNVAGAAQIFMSHYSKDKVS